jgi:5-methylthioadenosine/S-adenosylhomocysteine deaminase
MLDTVFFNADVVTVNPGFEVFRPGRVGVRSGRIVSVGPDAPGTPLPRARESVDVGGGVLMPGLVNAHTHLPMVLFRGLADDLPLADWLNDHIFPAERRHMTAGTVRTAARLACAELLLSGTTTCCDGYFHESAVAEAVLEAGIRGVLGQGVIDAPAPGVPDPAKAVETAAGFVDDWQGRNARVSPSIFCHSPYTCSETTLRRAKAAARERGVRFQIHVSETRSEVERSRAENGATPVGYLERLGLLDPETLVVHGVWLTGEDIRTLSDRGVPVVHCPESNMKLASGIAPVTALRAAGVTVALGTDGAASNNDQDLFREMDTAAKLHKAATGDPTALDARTVVRMATIEGARAVGLGEEVGSIEIGKGADLVTLAPLLPSAVPNHHPASLVVYSVDGGAVRDVMVAGRFRIREGRPCHMDLEEAMADARRAATDIDDTGGRS